MHGIACHFGLARVHREAVTELVRLVMRRCGHAGQLFVVQVKVAGGVTGQEQIRRARQPLEAGHFRLVDEALKGRGKRSRIGGDCNVIKYSRPR